MKQRPWTTSDEDRLCREYGRIPTPQLAARLGRTVKSVRSRAKVLGVRTRELLTDEQLAVIRKNHGKISAREIGKLIGRSICTVHNACHRLRLVVQPRIYHGAAFETFLREKLAAGWSDQEIADAWGEKIGSKVNRHTVRFRRYKLGLTHSGNSEHRRDRVRQKTREQLNAVGIKSLGGLRVEVFRQRAIASGWPEDLRPRAVQILNLLWDVGPMTRVQIAEAIGMPWKGSRASLKSNDPEGSYLANLIKRGLVTVQKRGCKVEGKGKGRSTDVYSLPIYIERKAV